MIVKMKCNFLSTKQMLVVSSNLNSYSFGVIPFFLGGEGGGKLTS